MHGSVGFDSERGDSPRSWSRFYGPFLVVALILLLELLRATPLRVSNPPAFFVLVIVFAGFQGGARPALASAIIAWMYTAYFFSGPAFPDYSEDNLRRIAVWALVYPLIAWMVGTLNRRAVKAMEKASRAMEEHARSEERARALEELRLSEIRFRAFVDHAADSFYMLDADGRIVDVNRQACEGLGYSREELIGMNPMDFDVGLPRSGSGRFAARSSAGEASFFESRHRRKDGTDFPVEIHVRPFRLGDRLFSVALSRDISERKQAEKALNESLALLRAVVEGTPDPIFAKDLQGRYRIINSAGARFLGRPVEEILGKDDAGLMPPDSSRAIRERDLRILASGEGETYEETVTAAETRTYLTTKGCYRDSQGVVIGLVGIARDITEVKRLESRLRQAQKLEALGRLAGGVAHDFNNLLTVINGYCEMVFNGLRPDDPGRGLLAGVQQAGERAVGLTRQLLAFSRKQVLQPRVILLNPLLADLGKMLQRLIGEGIEMTLDLDPGLGMTRVDPGQFEQAVINLAINARDAMEATGRLAIATRNSTLGEGDRGLAPDVRPGDYVMVTVSDTGHGMDEATKARIFEPFFTTKEAGKGTGLGLSMVYGFVKQSGGQIGVESEPGRGTTFRLYLPRTGEAEAPPGEARESVGIPKGDETVLLVEDEPSVRDLTRLVLQSYGYKVLEARDGQDGLLVSRQYPGTIHLVVTDLVMPRMGGRQLVENLRGTRQVPRILFMSGYAENQMQPGGEAFAGANFIQKPFSPMELARKVRQVLDAETPAADLRGG